MSGVEVSIDQAVVLRRDYLRGRVVALAERLQEADGNEALSVVDQLIEAANELVEVVAGESK